MVPKITKPEQSEGGMRKPREWTVNEEEATRLMEIRRGVDRCCLY